MVFLLSSTFIDSSRHIFAKRSYLFPEFCRFLPIHFIPRTCNQAEISARNLFLNLLSGMPVGIYRLLPNLDHLRNLAALLTEKAQKYGQEGIITVNEKLQFFVDHLEVINKLYGRDVILSVLDRDKVVQGFLLPPGIPPQMEVGSVFQDPSGALDEVLSRGVVRHNCLPKESDFPQPENP